MLLTTNLRGRLRNTTLPVTQPLLPLFEAVVNSIHSIDVSADPGSGEILIEVVRSPQGSFGFSDNGTSKALLPVVGFRITDNGVGFDEKNFASFQTLDSDYKASIGCRGVGRLLWLKAFRQVRVASTFQAAPGKLAALAFTFREESGVQLEDLPPVPADKPVTVTELSDLNQKYSERAPKMLEAIANALIDHCVWFYLRPGGAPKILLKDDDDSLSLDQLFERQRLDEVETETISVRGEQFEIAHLKLRARSNNHQQILWCAADRVVQEDNLTGKIPGLFGRLRDAGDEYVYVACVSGDYLNQSVRPERIGFDLDEAGTGRLNFGTLSLTEIKAEVIGAVARRLEPALEDNRRAGKKRVEDFVANKAPRYRPILKRVTPETLLVDPATSERDLELLLNRHLHDLEVELLVDGQKMMQVGEDDSLEDYSRRLADYLDKASDLKMSDLANYVFHRKTILDIFAKAIEKTPSGKYSREEVIHRLIMPLRKDSNEIVSEGSNLWLIDERLAFHDYLASDKSLSSMPITGSTSGKEPDLLALNTFDQPLLVAEGAHLPLASIVVVEIKRPMRNDAKAGEDHDPIEQALGYLKRVRDGQVTTSAGRPIPNSQEIPGFCYVLCDLTETIKNRCDLLSLRRTQDGLGYFGFIEPYKAYIQVVSFDGLLNAANQRNSAFFHKLGLPV
jgi:hypothetical protein